ncbi:hypothetical protein K678_05453 [Magnetospirillum fulvum MGU-K5]|uniref:Uncharacterized protein n=1 Tax=Magnetospirillum fulvum MGU-K5 TaxID=1316936 RepID=S9TJR4_MAGFU|nr:hypothetical protein K678_05453 [Magnetospirillum fulvum MGU-K5]
MSFFRDIKMDAAANSHGVLYLLFTHPGFQMLFFIDWNGPCAASALPVASLGACFVAFRWC